MSVSKLDTWGSKILVLKFSDITINIKYDLNLGEKRLLELVNACVSHEMRNPINSILGMVIKLKGITRSLLSHISQH